MALLPTGQWVRWTNLPSAADFQFTDLHRYSRCKQRFSLNFAAIDISLHANYALILLNTNCTNYTNMLLSLERFGRFGRFVFKNQHSILFLSRSRISRISRIFFRCKQRFVYHQDFVSTILLHMVHNY